MRSVKIQIGSRKYVCLHEAGHIEIANLSGVVVNSSSVDLATCPRTNVTHNDMSTKKPIACGGYAVEHLLFKMGRIVDGNGDGISAEEFEIQAMKNARLDKFPFYITEPFDCERGIYPDSPFQPQGEDWPPESDAPFIEYAKSKIVPKLETRIEVIWALAEALEASESLCGKKIEEIRRSLDNGDA